MIRALCPVCRREQPLNAHGRISTHRRRTESPLLRDRYGNHGTPCEGAGRLPHPLPDQQPPQDPGWRHAGRKYRDMKR